jgi:hypothetical protein
VADYRCAAETQLGHDSGDVADVCGEVVVAAGGAPAVVVTAQVERDAAIAFDEGRHGQVPPVRVGRAAVQNSTAGRLRALQSR